MHPLLLQTVFAVPSLTLIKEKNMKRLVLLSILGVFVLVAGGANANVWMDESFDDAQAFAPVSDGSGSVDDGVDLYSYNAIGNALSITDTGAISSARSFNGTSSYVLAAGQSVTAASPYQDQGNGPFQYFQFAVSLGSIPSTAGSMGSFTWDWDTDGTPFALKVDFVSNGTSVDIVAGLDGGSTATIDTLVDTNTWTYITVQVQKNATAEDDARASQTGVAQGAYFYSSSTTAGQTVTIPAGSAINAGGWTFSVTDGSIYLDEMYWEGGMTGDSTGNDNLRPFDNTSAVEGWTQY